MTWPWVMLGVVVGVVVMLVVLSPLFPDPPPRPEDYPGELLWSRVSGTFGGGKYLGEIRADSPDGKTATFRAFRRGVLIHEQTRTLGPSLHLDQFRWTEEWGYFVHHLESAKKRPGTI